MPGDNKVEEEKTEAVLDGGSQEALDYSKKEDAEAERLLAEALGKEPEKEAEGEPEKDEKKAEKEPGEKEKDTPGEPEKEPDKGLKKDIPAADEGDLTKDLTVENADKRISAAQRKMHDSNTKANTALDEVQRVKKENDELRALVADAATEETKKGETAPEEKALEATEGEVEKSLEALREEYPEIAEPMIKLLHKQNEENKALRERIDGVDARDKKREEDAKKEDENSHVNKIADAHPDYQDIAKEPLLEEWIDGLPTMEKIGAQAIRQGGSTDEVIQMITNFKKANGYEIPGEEKETSKKADSKLDKARKLTTPSIRKAKEVNIKNKDIKFTQEEIHNMSDAEFLEKEPEIDAALAAGLVV